MRWVLIILAIIVTLNYDPSNPVPPFTVTGTDIDWVVDKETPGILRFEITPQDSSYEFEIKSGTPETRYYQKGWTWGGVKKTKTEWE